MRKGQFLFLESGSLSKKLLVSCILCFTTTLILVIIGAEPYIPDWYLGLIDGRFVFRTIHAWAIFFFLLGLVFLIARTCVHKICEDIATLLRDFQEKK